MRVHRERFTWRDSKEFRIEVQRLVEKAPTLDINGSATVWTRVVGVVEIPPMVAGERSNHITAIAERLPQLLRATDATRQPTRGRDNRHGVAGVAAQALALDRSRRASRGRLGAQQPLGEVLGQALWRQVVKANRYRKRQAGGFLQTRVQIDCRKRTEAQIRQATTWIVQLRGRHAKRDCRMPSNEPNQPTSHVLPATRAKRLTDDAGIVHRLRPRLATNDRHGPRVI